LQLEETRHRPVEDTETILSTLDFEVRFVKQVDRHAVAEKTVEVENVKEELPFFVPRFVGQHDIHVVVEIAPRFLRTAGQAQVNAVIDLLVSAIESAVDVQHPRHALVDVL
jgi:hypothetical protein